jgi:hypothetical protein
MSLCVCGENCAAEDTLVVNHRLTRPRRTNPKVGPVKAGNANPLYAGFAAMILLVFFTYFTFHRHITIRDKYRLTEDTCGAAELEWEYTGMTRDEQWRVQVISAIPYPCNCKE